MSADPAHSPSTQAWLLSFDSNLHAAVGEREIQHVLHSPDSFTIPLSPSYCDRVTIWKDLLLPIFDLASWLTEGRQVCHNHLVGIVAYLPNQHNTPQYAGLRLNSPPTRLRVYDKQVCDLPEDIPAWRKIAVSCFTYRDDMPVPVLDLPSIFSAISQSNT